MGPSILVLGASTYQIPLIEAVVDSGHCAVVCDNCRSNPGHQLAQHSYEVDLRDHEGLIGVSEKHQVVGVVSPATDVGVVAASKVAASRNIAGIPLVAAETLTGKIEFRRHQEALGMPQPEWRELSYDRLLAPLGCGAWVVKPNRSSGSKGIRVVQEGLCDADDFALARGFSTDHRVIAERFLPGSQHSCEGVLVDGRVQFSAITDRLTQILPYTATLGHLVPSALREREQQTLISALERLFSSLSVQSAMFNCDFVVNGNQVVVLELSPRLGGNSLGRLVSAAYGIDLNRIAIELAVTGTADPHSTSPTLHWAMRILGVDRDGAFAFNAESMAEISKQTWVVSLLLDYPLGHPVRGFVDGRARVGECLLVAPDRASLQHRLDEVLCALALRPT